MKKSIFLLLSTIILGVNTSFVSAQAGGQEYVLKAAFLYRFTDYVNWGNNNSEENFNIAVVGESPITSQLNLIARDKKVKGRKIIIKEYENVNDVYNCQLIFISRNSRQSIETVMAKAGDKPILIIAEQSEACTRGAHINFLIADNRLKFEVNLNAAYRNGLKIGSQLLEHAILVNTP